METEQVSSPSLLRIADVAEWLNVSERTVRNEVVAGRLGCTRISHAIRFTREQVTAYIAAAQTQPLPPAPPPPPSVVPVVRRTQSSNHNGAAAVRSALEFINAAKAKAGG